MKAKEEPIRIAQIIGKWLGGGVESVVMNYYRHIDRTKIQFDFICDNDSTNIPYKEIEELGGKVILIPPYQKVFEYHRELKKLLKDGNYKIVHSHINTLSVFSLFAAKCAGVPVRIAHSHSTTNKKEWKKNIVKVTLRPFTKLVATDYMACTEHAGRWMFGNNAFDTGKVYILNNAIDLDKFKYNEKLRKKIRKELKISDSTVVIGHIGRFVTQKNHVQLIDIFNEYHKNNNNSVLMLIGQGPLMDTIKNKVNSLDLDDCVMFLGQKDNVSEYYNAMDLFLFPSLYEGLGMVAVEAQCSGLPCAVSNQLPSVVKMNNELEFYDLNDFNGWEKFILEFMRDTDSKSRAKKSRNTSLNIIKNGYSIKEESMKLQKYYLKK